MCAGWQSLMTALALITACEANDVTWFYKFEGLFSVIVHKTLLENVRDVIATAQASYAGAFIRPRLS